MAVRRFEDAADISESTWQQRLVEIEAGAAASLEAARREWQLRERDVSVRIERYSSNNRNKPHAWCAVNEPCVKMAPPTLCFDSCLIACSTHKPICRLAWTK